MKILISAAEASSDVHGAELLKALKARVPASTELSVFGIGGPELQKEGLRTLVDARELLSMGFLEIFSRLPKIFAALETLSAAARVEKPDVAVVIDYPDFHFRLARRLKAMGIPVVYYIPPKVWVWRKKRVRLLKELFSRILCIFPFEETFYRRENVAVSYVGNPLVDELPLEVSRAESRVRMGLGGQEKVLCLMPGSRPSELRRHLEPMLEGSVRAAAEMRARGALGSQEALTLLIPLPGTADLADFSERVRSWERQGGWDREASIVRVRVSQGDAAFALKAADAAMVKSGTSTLEAALLGCPHVVMYLPNALSCWIFKNIIRYREPVGLVNLILRDAENRPIRITEELLCKQATVIRLAEESVKLLTDGALRMRMISQFDELRRLIRAGSDGVGPSARAADEILSLVQ